MFLHSTSLSAHSGTWYKYVTRMYVIHIRFMAEINDKGMETVSRNVNKHGYLKQ